MNITKCPKKTVYVKQIELSKWPILDNKISKQLQSFLTSDVLFTNINHFGNAKFLHVTFSRGKPNTLFTLSHSNHCYTKHYLLEHCC